MKIISKNKSRIRRDFLIFFAILFLIIGLLIFTLGFSVYKSFNREREVSTKKYSTILVNRLTNTVGNYNDLLVYIGDKIAEIYDGNPESISHLFKHNNQLNSDFNNFFAWASFAFIIDKQIIISSEEGIIKNPIEVSSHYPLDESIRKPWSIHFDNTQVINGYKFIPISFGVTNSNGKYIGTIISSILIEQIERDLKSIESGYNDFVVLTEKSQILFSSFKVSKDTTLDAKSIDLPLYLGEYITLDTSHKTMFYPFRIISGYNKLDFNKYIIEQIKPYIKSMLLLTSLLLISFLIFKRKVISPLILELSKDLEKETALREEKERILSQILSNIPGFVYRHKIANNKILVDHISEGVKDLTGYSAEDYLNNTISYEDTIFPDDLEQVKSEINLAIEKKEKFDITYRVKSSDGNVKWVINKGKTIGSNVFEGILTDITDIKLAEKKMERAVGNLAKSNEELEKFAYICSHDLKEPLRTVFSYVSFLKEENHSSLDEQGKKYIKIIENDILKMRDIIENILSYSCIGHKNKESEDLVNLRQVIMEALSSLKKAIKDKNTNIIILDEEDIYVQGEYDDYLRLFQNIISNAVKFNDGNHPEIIIRNEKNKNTVIITVEDNGIGIENEYLKSVFDLFTRLNRQDEFPGTGIGLSISKKIVDKYKGKISIKSDIGLGTSISLEFNFAQ